MVAVNLTRERLKRHSKLFSLGRCAFRIFTKNGLVSVLVIKHTVVPWLPANAATDDANKAAVATAKVLIIFSSQMFEASASKTHQLCAADK